MIVETIKFIENDIHYIKQINNFGHIHIFPDPDFQTIPPNTDPIKPPLPDLNTVNQRLDFIINELRLKNRFLP